MSTQLPINPIETSPESIVVRYDTETFESIIYKLGCIQGRLDAMAEKIDRMLDKHPTPKEGTTNE